MKFKVVRQCAYVYRVQKLYETQTTFGSGGCICVCIFFFFSRVLGQILLLWLLFMHGAWIVATKFNLSNNFQPISAHRALFTNPQISLFSNFFIKNRFYGTIHIFKNYFATVFFNFQLYPNEPSFSSILFTIVFIHIQCFGSPWK